MHQHDAITWFEIPAVDLQRAQRFYETILACTLKPEAMGPVQMAVFPYQQPGVGGAVMAAPFLQPARSGSVVYLNAGPRIDEVLQRVAAAGGELVLPKTALPEGMGFFAHIVDTEGNRVGLHALN